MAPPSEAMAPTFALFQNEQTAICDGDQTHGPPAAPRETKTHSGEHHRAPAVGQRSSRDFEMLCVS